MTQITRAVEPKPEHKPVWHLHVDTNQYAGNFERQLVATMTGQYASCEVGSEEADAVEGLIQPHWAEAIPIYEHAGCWCYAECSRSSAQVKSLDRVSCTFYKEPPEDQIAFMLTQAEKYLGSGVIQKITLSQGWMV